MRWFRRDPRPPDPPEPNGPLPPPAPPPDPDWSLDGIPRPWTGESILAYLQAGLEPDGRLREDHLQLPDEPPDTGQLRWAPGALDGVLTTHTKGTDGAPEAVVVAILALTDHADAATLAATTEVLRTTDVLPVVDAVLKGLAAETDKDRRLRLSEIAHLLAYEAPERDLVKLGIALTGVFGDVAADRPTLETLGAHEEFTLFVAVALSNLHAGEGALWELAKRVDGWGRIQLVYRLAGTTDPEIRAWLLRDGFRNSVMDEYLAYTCAVAGGLLEALAPNIINDALFDGATDILAALARGGPAEDIRSYADREAAVSRWLDHVVARGVTLHAVSALDDLRGAALTPLLTSRMEEVARSPAAEAVVRTGLDSDDPPTFARAVAAAHVRRIDPTDRLLERTAAGDRYATFDLFRTIDAARIDQALEIMHARLDLDALASGPATELGLGEAFKDHFDLESVVNALARFPDRGVEFVLASLRSPVIRGRHAAIRTLRTWGPRHQTPEIHAALAAARAIEPNDAVRTALDQALAGAPIES